MKTEDLTIEECSYHPHADGFLVRGLLKPGAKPARPRYMVAWIARRAPERLIQPRRFLDPGSAREAFRQTLEEDSVPVALSEGKDWQKQIVYDWEDDILVPDAAKLTSIAEARGLVRRIARDVAMPVPKIVWEPERLHSTYDADEHCLYFGHRDRISLLHEMAHAVHLHRLGEKRGPDHSPGFVWIAVELYHLYAGIGLPVLIQSAAHRNLLGEIALQWPGLLTAPPKPAQSGPAPARSP